MIPLKTRLNTLNRMSIVLDRIGIIKEQKEIESRCIFQIGQRFVHYHWRWNEPYY